MNAVSSGRRAHAPVFIVGAGPVGLVAAIRLREQGVHVRIVDELTAETKRTYPAVLHAATLRVLSSLGVAAPLEWRGRPVARLALYADGECRSVLDVAAARELSPGTMTLPQDVLRQALTNRLRELGTEVEWKTRLVALDQDADRARLGIVRREQVEGMSSSLKPEWLDVASETVDADFVIGADGCKSSVRQKLGIEWVSMGRRQIYAFYDAPDYRAGDEAHLVFAEGTANSVYPLQSNYSRFTFQVGVAMAQAPAAPQLRQLLESRMPWYAAQTRDFEWSGSAEFHPALADRFGDGRVWLAGDAAHSTGPLGAQSVNIGIHEADELARRIVERVHNITASPLGPTYAERRRLEWQHLFGLESSRPRSPRTPDWVKRNLAMLLPSLPATGDDLRELLQRLHVELAA